MKLLKDILFVICLLLFVLLFLADIAAVLHTVWFSFSHIHLTRMELLVDPENYMLLKGVVIVVSWIMWKFIIWLSENWK